MRGPLDDEISTEVDAATEPEARGAEFDQRERRRPPGGKALQRLLQLTESAGFVSASQAAVAAAVQPDEREAFLAQAAHFTASPTGEPLGRAAADTRAMPRGRRTAPGESAGEAIASLYASVAEQLGPPVSGLPQWRSLGPVTIPNGQTYGATRVNVSGRVSCLAIDPNNPSHVLCGAAHGGVWESFDRGASWAPRTDYAPTLSIGALAFDRRDPRIVYCGTGEGNFWGYAPFGNGVMRSTDGGTTWAVLTTAPFRSQGFFELVIDPDDSLRLLAGTTGGLYTSDDGGVTWVRRRTQRTWSITIAGGADPRVLAACEDGLFSSGDGGVTWTAVPLPGASGTWERLEVAIAPSDPAIAYAWGATGGSGRLYREAGGSWSAIGAPTGVNVGQAWYDWFLAVSPDNPDQIYCGAIDAHCGTRSGASWTWLNLSSKSASGDSIHPDQHIIAFEPGNPDTLYIGNDGGVFRSTNRGVNFVHCNNGLVISEFEYIAQHPGSSRWLIGGLQDNGTARWQGSPTWDHVADGDGGDCGVNRTTPATAFHTYYGMSPERSTTSADWASWADIFPPVPAGEASLFYPPFECSATTGNTVAMGGGALYVSRANGNSWVRLAFPSGGTASALYIPNADTVLVGMTDGRIFRTRWNGSTWDALAALTTPRAGAYVSDLFADPANLNRIWATHRTVDGGRVWRSDNGGTGWADCTAGLPNLPVNAIEVDPANANRLWAALDLGVWQTLDGGTSWQEFSNGLPHMYVGDLVFQPHARVLRAGTRSRGVWEIPVDGWMTQPQCGVQWRGTVGPNASGTWFTHSWPATWHVVWTIMPTSVAPGAPQVSWTVRVERPNPEYATYFITITNLTGHAVDFEGRFCILSRY